MTKTDLTRKVAEVTGITQREVQAVLDALLGSRTSEGIIVASLRNDEKVTISGFGTFSLRQRAARQARNPKTGEKVKVARRSYPTFKAAKKLKDALRK